MCPTQTLVFIWLLFGLSFPCPLGSAMQSENLNWEPQLHGGRLRCTAVHSPASPSPVLSSKGTRTALGRCGASSSMLSGAAQPAVSRRHIRRLRARHGPSCPFVCVMFAFNVRSGLRPLSPPCLDSTFRKGLSFRVNLAQVPPSRYRCISEVGTKEQGNT